MTPRDFIQKWRKNALTERASAQEHFLDLCKLFEHPTPSEADPKGEFFAFEKGASKTSGGDGFADVWKQGYFAWEYKKRKASLAVAMKQLADYSAALDNPPIHVVCDTVKFIIETRWTNTITVKHEFDLERLMEDEIFALLRAVFHDPETLRPKQTRASLTRDAADKFQTISDRLQHRYADREVVAHFVNQLVFCFFANSVKLLPEGLLLKLIDTTIKRPAQASAYFDKLFTQMEKGGEFDLTDIRWFNGGLFDGKKALALDIDELSLLRALHSFRWDLIDPTIFGTLFERFLDPDKRAQIGAHYTDPEKISMIVEPVVMRPLRADWAMTKAQIEALLLPFVAADPRASGFGKKLETARSKASALRDAFIDRLTQISILDPACGSGNFLYIALQSVKDLEWRAILECEALDLGRVMPRVSPRILHGIEINPLAAELARTVIWIGDIQWGLRNGLARNTDPILEDLDTIECRDALVSFGHGASFETPPLAAPQDEEDRGSALEAPHAEERPEGASRSTHDGPAEAPWPKVDFIVGNPPFLGASRMLKEYGDSYVKAIRSIYADRVPGFSDLVCWWFAKAADSIASGSAKRAGFVATNSIRGGVNRTVLDRICREMTIFDAYADMAWINDGAAVRVSLISFAKTNEQQFLEEKSVAGINADLTSGLNLTDPKKLSENNSAAFEGTKKYGNFDIDGSIARAMLTEPLNPNSRPNSDVVRPWLNGKMFSDRRPDRWIIDFTDVSSVDVTLFEAPISYVTEHVKPTREGERNAKTREQWWRFEREQPELRRKISNLQRLICTSRVSKYRLFQWSSSNVVPDTSLVAIARDDDTTFGILHSRFHEAWSLRLGTFLGVGNDPRYTPSTTFETFPFPEGLTPNIPAADYATDPRAIRIAAAAKRLDELRRNWLYPADLGDWTPEIIPTAAPGEAPRKYPDRFIPKTVEAQVKLKERTLTNLYNQRPQWLADAHAILDKAVAAAYGWPEDISTDEALERLLALNLERAGQGR